MYMRVLIPVLRRVCQVVISDESPLVGIRLDDPVLQDVYSATVVGIRPAAHHLNELRTLHA